MRLVSFSVENFRSIRPTTNLTSLSTLNALIGPNNEGKSALLEALRLGRYFYDPFQNANFAESFMLDRLPDKDTANRFSLRLAFEFEEDEISALASQEHATTFRTSTMWYSLYWGGQISNGESHNMYPVDVELHLADGRIIPLVKPSEVDSPEPPIYVRYNLPLSEVFDGNDRLGQTLNQNLNQVRNYFVQQFEGIWTPGGWSSFLSHWAQHVIYVPSHRRIIPIGLTDVDLNVWDEATLPYRLHLMRNNQESDFRVFEQLIAQLIPSVRTVTTAIEEQPNRDNAKVSIRVSDRENIDATDCHRLDGVGSGVSELIYLASSIWLCEPGSTITIEEPERGLHAASQRLLVREAIAHAKENNKQLLWSTHSTIMAPLVEDCSVHLVNLRDPIGTFVNQIGKTEGAVVSSALGHWNLDLYNYDILLLLDGESEIRVLPEIIEYILGENRFRAIHIEPLRGNLRVKHDLMRHFCRLLAPSGTQIFAMTDDDDGVRETITQLETEFGGGHGFQSGNVHIWDCGVRLQSSGARGAEFEDNFCYQELVDAANLVAGGAGLVADDLRSRAALEPEKKISKVLQSYYYEIYSESLSKPELGDKLASIALPKIKQDTQRGASGDKYEFEMAIENLQQLLPYV